MEVWCSIVFVVRALIFRYFEKISIGFAVEQGLGSVIGFWRWLQHGANLRVSHSYADDGECVCACCVP